jgi:cytochrome d ubiquinol oxidase subunit I
MRVEDAATTNTGVWMTFIVVTILYIGLGATTILVLRGMSRRYREAQRFEETDSPYGPRKSVKET